MDILKIQKQAYEIHKAKGWEDDYQRNPDGTLTATQLLSLICLVTDEKDEEKAELIDDDDGDSLFYLDDEGKPCGACIEAVDSVIRALNVISSCGFEAVLVGASDPIFVSRHSLVKAIRRGNDIRVPLNQFLSSLYEEALDLSEEVDASLEELFDAKMKFNATRPPRHGGQLA